jgi:hypothetical protein
MYTIPLVGWIANAAARLTGPRGAVTVRALEAGCCRQSVYDHARKVESAVEAEYGGGPTRAELIAENEALRLENIQLWEWLFHSVDFGVIKQHAFSVTAMAMGLSRNQTFVLLAILLGTKACPSRSTIHRWAQAAGKAAGKVLKQLDCSCRVLVLVGCLDEIFLHRRPVLVGVEPISMVWFLGKKAANHQGLTWFAELQPWTSLRYVTSDAGAGLKAGMARMQQFQRETNEVPLEKGLDVFHTKREAQRALNVLWRRTERAWERADAADRALKQARWQGRSERKPAQQVRDSWTKAFQAFRLYEKKEAVWKRVEPALDVFRPDGQLNDRAWAQQQVAWALPRLSGPEWSKIRGLLKTAESFTFLDRMHNQLEQLSAPSGLRDALVHLWWLRRQRPLKLKEAAIASHAHILCLLQEVRCQKLDPNWRQWYREIAAVLSQTVRASSAVECMNSVIRMHHARHRNMTQGLLDLKRLYWNCRVFQGGKRKGRCPYEHLGLKLPSYDFWTLLQVEMTTALAEAKAVAKAKIGAAAA